MTLQDKTKTIEMCHLSLSHPSAHWCIRECCVFLFQPRLQVNICLSHNRNVTKDMNITDTIMNRE